MALIALVYPLCVFWVIVHALHHFWARKLATRSTLPGLTTSRQRGRSAEITLKYAYLHIETTRFNDLHDRITLFMAKSRHKLWKRAAYTFYNVGAISGVLGMLAAIYFLCSTVIWSLSSQMVTPVDPPPTAATFQKRDLDATEAGVYPLKGAHTSSRNAPVQLLIPGVTLPLSHLPLLILALFTSQVIHEAGHALTAAFEQVPLLAVGASLVVLLPSAHVSLPSAGLGALTPSSRLRVISAGAFHNLVLWLALAFLSWFGFGTFLWSCLGYEDVSSYGRVIMAVEEGSPVQAFLPVRAIITQIDDTPLASTKRSSDIWTSYALDNHKHGNAEDLGWCMNSAWFLSQPEGCCYTDGTAPNFSCFSADTVQSNSSTVHQKCAPTLEILRPDLDVVKRCATVVDCAEGNVCIKLREDQHIMRVDYTPLEHDETHQTVVWSGPPEEFFEDVETSAYLPRYSFLPVWLPPLVSTAFSYISTLTLSLYLFNLLPLPYLDGSQLLDALADLLFLHLNDRPLKDVELGGAEHTAFPSTSERQRRWYARIKRGIQICLELLLVVCLLSALWHSWQ